MRNWKIILPLTVFALTFALAHASPAPTKWFTVDANLLKRATAGTKQVLPVEKELGGVALMKMTEAELEALSHSIHENLHRCGGYVAHESEAEALAAMTPSAESHFAVKGIFADYDINQRGLVEPMVRDVSASAIEAVVRTLSAFHNRHYRNDTGVQSSQRIRDMWHLLARGRSDVKVELLQHANWPQPSVILTITGSQRPEEIVVLGGHADSINGGIFGGGARARAPGADDNASGIATLTETLRIAMDHNFRPARTVQFMAYAAEEAGLLGSKEIAAGYKREGKRVIGKIQFDMTLNKGTSDKDIVMMSDFTNTAQNAFVGTLIDEYVKVPWGYSRCGYGCSDHASWTSNGFPATMPFESTMGDINRNIHTDRDTIENTRAGAEHAAKFAQLAIAYMVELAN